MLIEAAFLSTVTFVSYNNTESAVLLSKYISAIEKIDSKAGNNRRV